MTTEPLFLAADASRSITLHGKYLNLPVKTGGPKCRMTVAIEGGPTREFDIELATGTPDFWTYLDISPYQGKTAEIRLDKPDLAAGLEAIRSGDDLIGAENLYHEALRPQFHFTPIRGWTNDPNGLVYYKGEYHLFFQHNPYGWAWGNMHWGHAVSPDLVHWKELPEALYPDEHGTMFSGSAVVDWHNSSGFQAGSEKPLVAMFTAAGDPVTQGIAFSNDRGRSWTKYSGNPVIPHIVGGNRDPKVVWYEPDHKWVMVLYLDGDEFGLFSSKDLKTWDLMSKVRIPGTSECPNFFPLNLDGKSGSQKWILYGGNGGYLVGDFDGHTFLPSGPPQRIQSGNCWYASQVYSDIPASDGRTILVPWGQIDLPGMPFNQMIGLPVELSLHSSDGGARIYAKPVRELHSLRSGHIHLRGRTLEPDRDLDSDLAAELAELDVRISVGDAKSIHFDLRGLPIDYDARTQELSCLDKQEKLPLVDGQIQLTFFVDRASVDIFGNNGQLYMPMGHILDAKNFRSGLRAAGGAAHLESLDFYPLKSIWTR